MLNYIKFVFLIICLSSVSSAQPLFTGFLNHINSLSDPAAKQASIDSFMIVARSQGIPLIEQNYATFIYNGLATSLTLAGDFNSWSSNSESFSKISGTNFWYKTKSFELNARLDYKFVRNATSWILDPENPHTCNGGFGPNSELSMPAYIQPWEINLNPAIPHGTVETRTLYSTNTLSTYNIRIYLPPGYNPGQPTLYPAAYFQDGFEYIDLASATNVIDNLIDSLKIRKIIGVFVRPNNRNEEYAFSKRSPYRLFFVNELVPFIDSLYKTIPQPAARLVLGDSYGGNISALISYNHPEVFGNCGLHSAAFQPNNYEAYSLIVSGPQKNIRFASVWGTYESLYSNMRNFRDALLSKGYDLKWKELPEGHSWGLWRASVDDMLEFFFPPFPAAIEENLHSPSDFSLAQNFPNPFNPSTIINFFIPKKSFVSLKVLNITGTIIAELINSTMNSGNHSVIFHADALPSGVYFYSLTVGNSAQTRKMILIK